MKYKMLTAVALMIAAWTPDAKAACAWCETTFVGEHCINERITSKWDPAYWACRTFIGSVYYACSSYVCPFTSTYKAKFVSNTEACKKGGDELKCQAELEKDVTSAGSNLSKNMESAWKQAEAKLLLEADKEAQDETKK